MPISYDGKKLIPAPYVHIAKSYLQAPGGRKIGATYNITLTGKVFSCKGSPMSSGFWVFGGYPTDETTTNAFAALLKKREYIQQLFVNDGRWLEIQPWDGSAPTKFRPRVKDIEFAEGQWTDYIDYTITLEADELVGTLGSGDFTAGDGEFTVGNTKLYLADATEDWSTELTEQYSNISVPVFRVTHSVSAVGKKNWTADGLEFSAYDQAKIWVSAQSGMFTGFLHGTGGLNLPSHYNVYNHTIVENQNRLGGSYGIDESWTIVSGTTPVIDEYTVSIQDSTVGSLTSVSIEGTIQGLETFDRFIDGVFYESGVSKYANASGYYHTISNGSYSTIFNRALAHSNLRWLNITPKSTSLGKNPFAGSITYSHEYDNRPETTGLIPGADSVLISLQHSLPNDQFGRVPVPGRTKGPVLQRLDMKTERKTSLSIEAFFPPFTGIWTPTGILACPAFHAASSFIYQIETYLNGLSEVDPMGRPKVFVEQDSGENWNPIERNYSRNITWTYELKNGISHVG